MSTDSQSKENLSNDFDFLEVIPDADLEAIWESLQNGGESLGDAVGFDDAALNSVEEIALGYYRSRRYDQAATIYGFVLQMNTKRSSAWRGLGACAHAQQSYLIAMRCYQAACSWNPQDVVSKVYTGECMCMLGDKESGLALLEEVVEQGSEDSTALPYITRARAIIGADGGIPPRVVLLKEGQQLIAETEEALSAMGAVFDEDREIEMDDMMRNPQLRDGIATVKEAIREGRLTYADVGGFTEIELEGAYASACNLAAAGQGVEAIEICGYLMMVDPYKGRYYQLVGVSLQRMKQYELADHYYRIALTLDKEDPMSLIYRGECKIMLGRIDEGVDFVKEGVGLAEGKAEHKEVQSRGEILIKQFGA